MLRYRPDAQVARRTMSGTDGISAVDDTARPAALRPPMVARMPAGAPTADPSDILRRLTVDDRIWRYYSLATTA